MRTMLLGFAATQYLNEMTKNNGSENEIAARLKEGITKEIAVYQRYLDSLEKGSAELGLEVLKDRRILNSLETVKERWKPFREGISDSMNDRITPEQRRKSLEAASLWKAGELVEAINETVVLLNNTSNRKISFAIVTETTMLLFLMCFFGLALVFIRKIIHPVRVVSLVMEDIAAGAGALTTRLDVSTEDEPGRLSGSFNKFTERIGMMIADAAELAALLAGSSKILLAEAQGMSANAQNQAATAEEKISSIEIAESITSINGLTRAECAGN